MNRELILSDLSIYVAFRGGTDYILGRSRFASNLFKFRRINFCTSDGLFAPFRRLESASVVSINSLQTQGQLCGSSLFQLPQKDEETRSCHRKDMLSAA